MTTPTRTCVALMNCVSLIGNVPPLVIAWAVNPLRKLVPVTLIDVA